MSVKLLPNAAPEALGFAAYVLHRKSGMFEAQDAHADLATCMDDTGARAIIVYDDPVTAIARRVQNGQDPADALEQWHSLARRHLVACRRMRRRIVLCQRPGNAADAEALQEELGKLFSGAAEFPVRPATGPPDKFFLGLATIETVQDADALDLIRELQARSIGLAADPPGLAGCAQMLLSRWHERIAESDTYLNLLNQQISELERALRITSAKHDGDRKQQIADTSRSATALMAENKRLKDQLRAFHASRSWRVTAPIRAISRLVQK